VQALEAHLEGVIAFATDRGLDFGDLLRRHGLLLPAEGDGEVSVLGDDGDDRLARHVAAADQHVGAVEARRVEELLPADLRAVEVGREKDLRHSLYLSTSTLRISRSKPITCRRMIVSASSPSPARIARSSSTCSSTASRSRTSRSRTRYQSRRLRLKQRSSVASRNGVRAARQIVRWLSRPILIRCRRPRTSPQDSAAM